jgi:hypothetical protein
VTRDRSVLLEVVDGGWRHGGGGGYVMFVVLQAVHSSMSCVMHESLTGYIRTNNAFTLM